MAKQVKIKDIAKMAGVSAGTVDRILHNRGNVSAASREAVERVLAETGYKYNIHTSAISLRKEYKIVIAIPTAVKGEYWGAILAGVSHALEEYSDININCIFSFYNQFDIYSCRASFGSIMDHRPDAVIIGATFITETMQLCNDLDRHNVPYAFVDAVIEGTNPIVSYSTNQNVCGHLIGRLMHTMAPEGSEYAIFGTRRVGNERSLNSLTRKAGFHEYFGNTGLAGKIKETKFSVLDPHESEMNVLKFLEGNPEVRGIAVMNSRGYIIADILSSHNIKGMTLISFDLTANNMRCIKDGSISAVICQRPELQGFSAVKATIRYLLYKQEESIVHHMMPVDIILKENVDFYTEFLDIP